MSRPENFIRAVNHFSSTVSTIVGQKRRSEGYLLVLPFTGSLYSGKAALFVSGASTVGNSMGKGHMHRYEWVATRYTAQGIAR